MDCLLSVSYPVALKDHRCDCCGKRISKGQRQEVQKQIFDGRPCTYRAHDDCAQAEQRARELAGDWNEDADYRVCEMEPEDEPWLREEFPAVAVRRFGEPTNDPAP